MLKNLERYKWIIITCAVCITIIISACIVSNSNRYAPMQDDGNSLSILDTKTGTIYTPTNGFYVKDKRVWIRRKLSNAKFQN